MNRDAASKKTAQIKPPDCHVVAIIGARGGSKGLPGKNIRQLRTPVFREDTGLACATRAHLIKSGRRVGDKVDIVVNHDFCSSIDIHDEFDLWLAEKVLTEGHRTIND